VTAIQRRSRKVHASLVSTGKLPAGYATEDGAGWLYAGTELLKAITILLDRNAW
jgi:hypothetical protein